MLTKCHTFLQVILSNSTTHFPYYFVGLYIFIGWHWLGGIGILQKKNQRNSLIYSFEPIPSATSQADRNSDISIPTEITILFSC